MESATAIKELAFIKKAMMDSQKFAIDTSFLGITWGLVLALGSFTTYFYSAHLSQIGQAILVRSHTLVIWGLYIGVGWIISGFELYFRQKKQEGLTYTGKVLRTIIIGNALGASIFTLLGSYTITIHGLVFYPVWCVILGNACLAFSAVSRIKIVFAIGMCWWLGTVTMIMKGLNSHLPVIFGVMCIILLVLPESYAFYMRNKGIKELDSNLSDDEKSLID